MQPTASSRQLIGNGMVTATVAQLIIFVLSCDAPTSTWHGLQELAGRLVHLPVQAAHRQTLIERLAEHGFDISVFGCVAGESTKN